MGDEWDEVEEEESVLAVEVGDRVAMLANESVSLLGSDMDSL